MKRLIKLAVVFAGMMWPLTGICQSLASICSGASTVLPGLALPQAVDSYTWEQQLNTVWVAAPGTINLANYETSGLINNTSANVVVSLRRKVVSQNNTSYDSFFDVTVKPGAAITGNVITARKLTGYCTAGDPLVITGSIPSGGSGSYTYQWQRSEDDIDFTDLTGETSKDFYAPAVSASGYYRRIAFSGTCTASVTSNVNYITVAPSPELPVVASASVCSGNGVTLTVTNADPAIIYEWFAAISGGTALFTGNTFTTTILTASTAYYVEATNSNGCFSSRVTVPVLVIQKLPAPVVQQKENTTTSVTFQWNAVAGASGYEVSMDNGNTFTVPTSGSAGFTHTVSGLLAGNRVTIQVRAMGATPCQQSPASAATGAALAVNESADEIFVPNAFTPNGDGTNDVLLVYHPLIQSLNLYIYDQWGKLLFKSASQDTGWDGNYRNTRQPAGVYVYFLEAITTSGNKLNKKGTVTLVR